MTSSTDDEGPIDGGRVRMALEDMLRAGQLRRPPLSAAELRTRGKRLHLPRTDVKGLVALAAAVALIVLFFTVEPLHHHPHTNTPAATPSVPSGWTAHSAYGLQIAAPRTWSVQVFGQCPDGAKPGTLFIGTSRFDAFCPFSGAGTSQVAMYSTDSQPFSTGQRSGSLTTMRVNGLSVTSSRIGARLFWSIPSMHVTITGSGPKALSIMRSLAPATPSASPAVGQVNGTEYLEALVRASVSGPVTVSPPSGPAFTVAAVNGQFYFTVRPGRYRLTGHDGNTSCAPVSVTVSSGEQIVAPPIQCQGD
jgi:hypothetical protein